MDQVETGTKKQIEPFDESKVSREGMLYMLLNRFSRWPMFLATGAACITMIFLFATGFFEFAKAISLFFGFTASGSSAPPADVNALKISVRALEFLLLAPLPYLIMLSLVRYVEAMAQEHMSARIRAELAEVKAFWFSLLIGILAATLVAKATSENGLTYETAISGAVVITALAVYFFGLKKVEMLESKTAQLEQQAVKKAREQAS